MVDRSRTLTPTVADANERAPKVLDVPIGVDATGMRREFDSLGEVEVRT